MNFEMARESTDPYKEIHALREENEKLTADLERLKYAEAKKAGPCKSCPHVIGDATERDCCFPDCVGGWEQVFHTVCSERDEAKQLAAQRSDQLREENQKLRQSADRYQERWDYYQDFCKAHGAQGITHLVVQRDRYRKALGKIVEGYYPCDPYKIAQRALDDE